EQGGEAVHLLLEERLYRFRRDVAPGEAGAAGGDDDVDGGIGDPRLHPGADRLDVVGDDVARGELMPRPGDALGERRPRLVVGERTGVGYRQHCDAQRHERLALVDARHRATSFAIRRVATSDVVLPERVAGGDVALFEPGHEPALALCRGTM